MAFAARILAITGDHLKLPHDQVHLCQFVETLLGFIGSLVDHMWVLFKANTDHLLLVVRYICCCF